MASDTEHSFPGGVRGRAESDACLAAQDGLIILGTYPCGWTWSCAWVTVFVVASECRSSPSCSAGQRASFCTHFHFSTFADAGHSGNTVRVESQLRPCRFAAPVSEGCQQFVAHTAFVASRWCDECVINGGRSTIQWGSSSSIANSRFSPATRSPDYHVESRRYCAAWCSTQPVV